MSLAVRTEFERPPGAECDPPAGVEGHLTAFERRGQRGGGAAAKSTHAGHELGEVKGLRQVAAAPSPRPSTRSLTVLAAVSISTRLPDRPATILRQTSSPRVPGRSRSSTTTS